MIADEGGREVATPTPAATTKPEREVVWEPADEGGLAPDWMAVKGAGWVEAPSDYDDGEGLVVGLDFSDQEKIEFDLAMFSPLTSLRAVNFSSCHKARGEWVVCVRSTQSFPHHLQPARTTTMTITGTGTLTTSGALTMTSGSPGSSSSSPEPPPHRAIMTPW